MQKKDIRVTLAQLDFLVGDIEGNADKIITAISYAKKTENADVVIFPELALCGYPPEDLLFRDDFNSRLEEALTRICEQSQNILVILGHPLYKNDHCYNTASVFENGSLIATYAKHHLPNYGIFDEKRYFTPGTTPCVFSIKGLNCAITICEDLWHPEPAAQAVAAGADLIFCINASPFELKKDSIRKSLLQERIEENHVPIISVYSVGGQDELVFDGGSMALDAQGKIISQANFFQEQLFTLDINLQPEISFTPITTQKNISDEAHAYHALQLGLRDYVNKNHFSGVLVGLSGGIDSALTLAIAVDALGADRVHAVIMPSRFSSSLSLSEAKKLADTLKVSYDVISIESSFTAFLSTLAKDFALEPASIAEQNIQSRCRMILLYAISNQTGKLVLNTSNKSELAMGYGTLYGDMAGGFAVLKDVYKIWVYRLAEFRNTINPVISSTILERPPTAELAPHQLDSDTLPPYPILDLILELYLEQNQGTEELIAAGFDEILVKKVLKAIKLSEYKRRQAPPGTKITPRAFGRDWRQPLTSGYSP